MVPLRVRVPAPVLVKPKFVPEIAEEITAVPAILKVPSWPKATFRTEVPAVGP